MKIRIVIAKHQRARSHPICGENWSKAKSSFNLRRKMKSRIMKSHTVKFMLLEFPPPKQPTAIIKLVVKDLVQRFRTSGTETISWFVAEGELV